MRAPASPAAPCAGFPRVPKSAVEPEQCALQQAGQLPAGISRVHIAVEAELTRSSPPGSSLRGDSQYVLWTTDRPMGTLPYVFCMYSTFHRRGLRLCLKYSLSLLCTYILNIALQVDYSCSLLCKVFTGHLNGKAMRSDRNGPPLNAPLRCIVAHICLRCMCMTRCGPHFACLTIPPGRATL